MASWIESELLPLRRPEYANQIEALLTDLLWRSPGSNRSVAPGTGDTYLAFLQTHASERLVARRIGPGKNEIVETIPLVARAEISRPLEPTGYAESIVEAFLYSILAPKAGAARSVSLVPLHPDLIAFQTLHGLVNKTNPPDLAGIVETVGRLGGSAADGSIAAALISALREAYGGAGELTTVMDSIYSHLGTECWENTVRGRPGAPGWGRVETVELVPEPPLALALYRRTPFWWFREKWDRLCNPAAGWSSALPVRRFVDWALALLRTGLAFSYMWEAQFYRALHGAIREFHRQGVFGSEMQYLQDLLSRGAVLATVQPASVPASQKEAWAAVANSLGAGYEIRHKVQNVTSDSPPAGTVEQRIEKWLCALDHAVLESLAQESKPDSKTAKNQKEFVRYLLQQRSSRGAASDEADLYFLMRSNSRHAWFHPGPEWLVVVVSLLAGAPGQHCTLGMLVSDLDTLGLRIERSVLVTLLEEAGLSTDSPDADEAILIRAGF